MKLIFEYKIYCCCHHTVTKTVTIAAAAIALQNIEKN